MTPLNDEAVLGRIDCTHGLYTLAPCWRSSGLPLRPLGLEFHQLDAFVTRGLHWMINYGGPAFNHLPMLVYGTIDVDQNRLVAIQWCEAWSQGTLVRCASPGIAVPRRAGISVTQALADAGRLTSLTELVTGRLVVDEQGHSQLCDLDDERRSLYISDPTVGTEVQGLAVSEEEVFTDRRCRHASIQGTIAHSDSEPSMLSVSMLQLHFDAYTLVTRSVIPAWRTEYQERCSAFFALPHR